MSSINNSWHFIFKFEKYAFLKFNLTCHQFHGSPGWKTQTSGKKKKKKAFWDLIVSSMTVTNLTFCVQLHCWTFFYKKGIIIDFLRRVQCCISSQSTQVILDTLRLRYFRFKYFSSEYLFFFTANPQFDSLQFFHGIPK